MPYEMVDHEGQVCIRKKGASEMVPGSCHADRADTERMMRAMMANEKMGSDYLRDEFVATHPGQPYRLFPFGKIVKNGQTRVITPELASQFKLPHFKPAIKLGSHDDPTPAGGHIIGLEVRADGLYAVPEWNDAGAKALEDGAYRYHSPEVIWGDGALEDPQTGAAIPGPLLLGDALLHMPHLGEATALYGIEPISNKETDTMEEKFEVPSPLKGMWDKFLASLTPAKAEPERVEVIPEDYEAAKQERDELKARFEAQAKADERKALVEKFDAELKETKADPSLAELLADIPAEAADAILRQLKALSAQVDETAITEEKGTEGQAVDDPKAAFNAAVLAIATEQKITYNAAFEQAKSAHADLFAAWARK